MFVSASHPVDFAKRRALVYAMVNLSLMDEARWTVGRTAMAKDAARPRFQDALDVVESLDPEDQELLIQIIGKRLI